MTFSRLSAGINPPLATLPSKQGLKQIRLHIIDRGITPLATLPSKQGLKRILIRRQGRVYRPPLATLPSKQGLKRRATAGHTADDAASCYTSIKTRIETQQIRPTELSQGIRPLATLPSKQGLKPRAKKRRRSCQHLLLHFHQNKD